uniref:Uncharacterized protein n=1 Tax=Anguilla anguilla TaxID=7936 RepID=A0A0E9WTF8_ANGAN
MTRELFPQVSNFIFDKFCLELPLVSYSTKKKLQIQKTPPFPSQGPRYLGNVGTGFVVDSIHYFIKEKSSCIHPK